MNAVALLGLLAAQWAEAPDFAPGARVRVHVLEQGTFGGIPKPEVVLVTYSGTLTYYAVDDGLTLERDKILGTYQSPATVTFPWMDVHRIDVPAGSKWLRGAAAGGIFALISAAGGVTFCVVFGGLQPGASGCPFWDYAAHVALVSVPVGAIVGSQFTRWKPVYKRKR